MSMTIKTFINDDKRIFLFGFVKFKCVDAMVSESMIRSIAHDAVLLKC